MSDSVSSLTSPATAFADLAQLRAGDTSVAIPPRITAALQALREGRAVALLDDDDRENEADLIYAAEKVDVEGRALMIRECSGIVCLCLPDETVRALHLPPMVADNGSKYGTAFTVSIEEREGVERGGAASACGSK